MTLRWALWMCGLGVALAFAGCSDDSGENTAASGGSSGAGGSSGSAGGGSGGTAADSGLDPDAVYDDSAVDGRFPVFDPLRTVVIGPNQPGNGLTIDDIQQEHPEIASADRLYIEAGQYAWIEINNLPERTPDRPLVITNLGGQVRVGGLMGGHSMTLRGGSNWVLTGRYDPISSTGDAAFPGHKYGYAGSAGKYGIWLDDEYLHTTDSCGLYVGAYPDPKYKATDFELEFIEASRNSYCGMSLKNDDVADAKMSNVRVHDNYLHDNLGEQLYLGSTQNPELEHTFEKLRVYNNRFLRADYEVAQFGQLDDDCEIHHNVFLFGALKRLDQFTQGQDNSVQFGVRNGKIRFHHNVVIGAGFANLIVFRNKTLAEHNDDNLDFVAHDNYFDSSLTLGVYIGGRATAELSAQYPAEAESAPPSKIAFADNFFRGVIWGYDRVKPGSPAPTTAELISADAFRALMEATGNRFDGSLALFPGIPAGAGDGTSSQKGGNFTATGNVPGQVAPYAFADLNFPGTPDDYSRYERWLNNRGGGAAADYPTGMVVQHLGKLYRAKSDNSGQVPPDHPEIWQALPAMNDDARQAADSPYASLGIGLLDDVRNAAPVVDLGVDRDEDWADSGELLGTVSDSDSNVVSLAWHQLSGPANVTLQGVRSLRLRLSGVTSGVYTFRLSASDAQGASGYDDITITVP